MPITFTLCPDCTAQFQALQFNANASCHPVLIPFGSIVWGDEMPPRESREFVYHQECRFSLIRLISARKQLWKTGHLDVPGQNIFAEAQQLLPNWPGFRRLTLSEEDRAALQDCEEETDELMGVVRQRSAVFTLTDQGGGVVSFTSHPHPPEQEK